MFYVQSVPMLYNEEQLGLLTVTLRVVGGDKKEVWNLRQWNMAARPTGLGPESDSAGEGEQQPVLSSERAPQNQQTPNCQTIIEICS
jgi:hypothetical protein